MNCPICKINLIIVDYSAAYEFQRCHNNHYNFISGTLPGSKKEYIKEQFKIKNIFIQKYSDNEVLETYFTTLLKVDKKFINIKTDKILFKSNDYLLFNKIEKIVFRLNRSIILI